MRALLRLAPLGPLPPSAEGLTAPPRTHEEAHAWHLRHATHSRYLPVAPAFRGEIPIGTPTHPILQTRQEQERYYEVPETYVIEIPYGRVVSKKGAIVTHDHVLLSDLTREFFCEAKDNPILSATALPKAKRMKGTHAVISGPGNCTYHWLMGVLPRVGVLRRAGYSLDEFDSIIASKPKFPEHLAALQQIGVPMEKIRWCTTNTHLECERLVVPSYTNNLTRQNQPFVYPVLAALVGDFVPPTPRLRLYVSRDDCNNLRRRVVNEEELLRILEAEGFQKITLTGLDFTAQARLFASAEMIVAPHGGGLSNLLFARRPMKLMEIFAPDYSRGSMRAISLDKGFGYNLFMGEHVPSGNLDPLGEDIRIDLVAFKKALREFLDG